MERGRIGSERTKSVFKLMIWDDQPLKPNTSLARLIAVFDRVRSVCESRR